MTVLSQGKCSVKLEKAKRFSPETPREVGQELCLNTATIWLLFFGGAKIFLGAVLLWFQCQLTIQDPKNIFLNRTGCCIIYLGNS